MSFSYLSDKNVLKRHSSSGSQNMAAPAALTALSDYTSSTTVTHSLGYIPQVRVYFESSATDGKIYPAGGNRNGGTYPGLPANSVYCTFTVTTTTLVLSLFSNTSKTGTRKVYYVIYEDTPV
jgi:hypothetical protein